MRIPTLALLIGLTSLMAQAAPTDRNFNDRRALNGDAKLGVRSVAGLIEVVGWDKNEVELTASLGESAEKIDITGNASDLQIEVKNRKKSYRYGDGETRLQLKVPAGVSMTLDATSADLVVRDTRGALTARSVSGDVDLTVAARQLSVQSVSGDLRINARAARETRLNTVSGDTQVTGAAGALSAESVSGDVQIEGGVFSRLELQSVSGDIAVHAGFASDAKVSAESLSGDVRINAPASLSAEVTLKTFSGDRRCDFEGAREASDGKRSVMKIGEGRGQLSLTSFSGDVSLDRQQ